MDDEHDGDLEFSNAFGEKAFMPLIVTMGQGGPYEESAFFAGMTFAAILAELDEDAHESYEWVIPGELLPQVDLVAMFHGLLLSQKPATGEDHELGCNCVTVTLRPPSE